MFTFTFNANWMGPFPGYIIMEATMTMMTFQTRLKVTNPAKNGVWPRKAEWSRVMTAFQATIGGICTLDTLVDEGADLDWWWGYSDFCLLQGLGPSPDFKPIKILTNSGTSQILAYLPMSQKNKTKQKNNKKNKQTNNNNIKKNRTSTQPKMPTTLSLRKLLIVFYIIIFLQHL